MYNWRYFYNYIYECIFAFSDKSNYSCIAVWKLINAVAGQIWATAAAHPPTPVSGLILPN